MKTGKEGERFERLYKERCKVNGMTCDDYVLRDKVTGVLYLQTLIRGNISTSPLLGTDGMPIIEPVEK